MNRSPYWMNALRFLFGAVICYALVAGISGNEPSNLYWLLFFAGVLLEFCFEVELFSDSSSRDLDQGPLEASD